MVVALKRRSEDEAVSLIKKPTVVAAVLFKALAVTPVLMLTA
jgi:hypothetical protein